jgi:hypothetical protein
MAKRISASVQDEDHFAGHRILVQGHRHAAQHLRRAHRPVKARPVVTDDRQVVAALEAEFGQTAGHGAHFLRHLRSSSRSARCQDISRALPDDRRAPAA